MDNKHTRVYKLGFEVHYDSEHEPHETTIIDQLEGDK